MAKTIHVKAENWVDDKVSVEVISETKFKYSGNYYKLVPQPTAIDVDDPDPDGKYAFKNLKMFDLREGQKPERICTVSKWAHENFWELEEDDIYRSGKDPIETVVKYLAMIGA